MSTTKRKWTGGEWWYKVRGGRISITAHEPGGPAIEIAHATPSVFSGETWSNAHLFAGSKKLFETEEHLVTESKSIIDYMNRCMQFIPEDFKANYAYNKDKLLDAVDAAQAALQAALGEGE